MNKYFLEVQKYLELICIRDNENYEEKIVETVRDLLIHVCSHDSKNIKEFRLLLDKLEEISK